MRNEANRGDFQVRRARTFWSCATTTLGVAMLLTLLAGSAASTPAKERSTSCCNACPGRTGFAFPSQTLYLGKDEGLSAQRGREVAEEVQRWRERSEIFLPNFPPERIAAIENALAYPAEGSPEHRATG